MKLDRSFYLRDDVVELARDLLGKYLFTDINNAITGGYITEVEAYAGTSDRASHAWGKRRTARTEVMYHDGGVAYVYLCYGIHSLFNIVTNKEGIPHAILVRGIHPTHGLDLILKRSGKPSITHRISDGPGKVSKILGIKTTHSGTDLLSNTIWLEDRKMIVSADEIEITRRIGIDYAGIDARRPYRFVYKQKNPGIAGAFMLY